jgi:dipeptidase
MACTTILVGKDVSYDGSTIIARNEDSANGEFNPKRFLIVKPSEQPRHYRSVISHVELDLPDDPLQYSAVPNADAKEGIWGEAGVNEANVAMSATETLTTNERVRGADPMVELTAAKGAAGELGYEPEVPGGIGEEDFLTIVLPYVTTAREGVARLGSLLEQYGTYEMNGVAFSDASEIWWLETVGGHHWIAKRVPDEAYVTMPNQLGIDEFDLDDALGDQEDHMCSADLAEFIEANHLDLSVESTTPFNPRDAFGSHSDSDHVYNTPRAWFMQRFLNPTTRSGTGRMPTTAHRATIFHGRASLIARSPSKTSNTCSARTIRARHTTRTASSATSIRAYVPHHRHQPAEPARRHPDTPLPAADQPRHPMDGLRLEPLQRARAVLRERRHDAGLLG